jgi:hypothetical protein
MPESEAGFSVGFWFSKRKPEKRGEYIVFNIFISVFLCSM